MQPREADDVQARVVRHPAVVDVRVEARDVDEGPVAAEAGGPDDRADAVQGPGAVGGRARRGAVGRGERLNAAQKERMRLLTTAAFDRGKGEDTFGMRDEDWLVYNKMSKENEEDDGDDDESELARIASKIQV